ncbi:amidase domain-containing protein [Pasteuria penetrans]|uniref:amidase domain-containing protein n=1 Tax=Pasteuria penetrans TaxID=86005 RepID=UPI00165C2465|nr:amidase domain-containing protein [Pasteuria penetrans]
MVQHPHQLSLLFSTVFNDIHDSPTDNPMVSKGNGNTPSREGPPQKTDALHPIRALATALDWQENEEKNYQITELTQKIAHNAATPEDLIALRELQPHTEQGKRAQENLDTVIHTLLPNDNGEGNIPPPTHITKRFYRPNVAISYAHRWAFARNEEPNYRYFSRLLQCKNCWRDCTNFVSQTLHAGGLAPHYGDHYATSSWYPAKIEWNREEVQRTTPPSITWSIADSLQRHLAQRGAKSIQTTPTMGEKSLSLAAYKTLYTHLEIGDPLFGDWAGDGDFDHVAIISKRGPLSNGEGGQPYPHMLYVTQHTPNRKDHPITVWFAGNHQARLKGYSISSLSAQHFLPQE